MLDARASDDSLAGRQVDQRADGLTGPLQGSHLEPLRHGEEEHDGRRLEPLAEQQGAGYRDHHEGVDVEGARTNGDDRAPGRVDAASDGGDGEAHRGVESAPGSRKDQAGADRDGTHHHQTPAPFGSGAALGGLVVLQPHPHAGLANGIDDCCRRQAGRVILDVQPLPHEVGRDRFDAGQGRQSAFEDDHLLLAVHSLDAKNRLGVQHACRAGLDCVRSGHVIRVYRAGTGLRDDDCPRTLKRALYEGRPNVSGYAAVHGGRRPCAWGRHPDARAPSGRADNDVHVRDGDVHVRV